MKKIVISVMGILIIIGVLVFSFYMRKENKKDDKKIKVAEVTHSIFYAPQYLAHALGYFKDEGLDVDIILTSGADAVAAAVMSGDVQIGFCGNEQTIYTYNQGAKDYLISFAALTKKDGSFLVSRKKIDHFSVKDLVGKHLIAGRKGGMPAMTLEYALNQQGLKTENLQFDTSIAFSAMSGTFVGGTGDFVSLFEPNALQLEKQGIGYVVASIGELGGNVPYTVYNAKKSYIEDNKAVIKGFKKAIDRGLDYVAKHKSEDIAKYIADYFPDVSRNDLIEIINRYKKIDAWFKQSDISEKDFNHIQDIMENAGELTKRAPYDKLVHNK